MCIFRPFSYTDMFIIVQCGVTSMGLWKIVNIIIVVHESPRVWFLESSGNRDVFYANGNKFCNASRSNDIPVWFSILVKMCTIS